MPNFLALLMTRLSYMSRTTTWSEEPASRITASITSWQAAHPALNTYTLRLLAIFTLLEGCICYGMHLLQMHLGSYSEVKCRLSQSSVCFRGNSGHCFH